MTVWRRFAQSRKARVTLAAVVAGVAGHYEIIIDPELSYILITTLLVYVGAQGVADSASPVPTLADQALTPEDRELFEEARRLRDQGGDPKQAIRLAAAYAAGAPAQGAGRRQPAPKSKRKAAPKKPNPPEPAE